MCNSLAAGRYSITLGPGLVLDLASADDIADLASFFKLIKKDFKPLVPPCYSTMASTLNLSHNLSLDLIPAGVIEARYLDIVEDVQSNIQNPQDASYILTYIKIKRFLRGLISPNIDTQKLSTLISKTKNPSVISTLRSFNPVAKDVVGKTSYATDETITGRLKVKSGPKILTAPAKLKGCLKSAYRNGKVLQIDLKSAEPKLALHIKNSGGTVPGDVYSDIANNVLGGKINRRQAKFVTLCALYGQSPAKLGKQLPTGMDARGVISRVREYFGYYALKKQLQNDYEENNFRNALGRPIAVTYDNKHNLLSYFLQSSIAEASIMMFAEFCDRFSAVCRPNYVIHDALIVDCHPEFAKALLKKQEVKLKLNNNTYISDITALEDI